jgi:protein farnesyltransferase subunit beta
MQAWLLRLKCEGFFMAHEHGECDLRGIYIAVLLTKFLKLSDSVLEGCLEAILSCQTYEGGFSDVPGGEAHAGYTYCALAALALLNKLSEASLGPLMHWLGCRQKVEEGGFCGRTNKLVDTCYSFWVAACFHILDDGLEGKGKYLQYDREKLLKYVLECGQDPKGGLRDKPEMKSDFYHTCYGLLGLALCGGLPCKVDPVATI